MEDCYRVIAQLKFDGIICRISPLPISLSYSVGNSALSFHIQPQAFSVSILGLDFWQLIRIQPLWTLKLVNVRTNRNFIHSFFVVSIHSPWPLQLLH